MWEVRECEYGKGVFAINDIPPLTLIGTYLGKQISREKYKLKKQSLQRYSDYCAEVNKLIIYYYYLFFFFSLFISPFHSCF